MKIKQGDTVVIITGKDKGKTGKVVRTLKKHGKIVVEKVNIATKHIKKKGNEPGQKIQLEKPIDASNAMILCPKTKKKSRIGYQLLKDGKKERFAKVSKSPLQ